MNQSIKQVGTLQPMDNAHTENNPHGRGNETVVTMMMQWTSESTSRIRKFISFLRHIRTSLRVNGINLSHFRTLSIRDLFKLDMRLVLGSKSSAEQSTRN